METGNHRVEVFIDGSLVYTTREPGELAKLLEKLAQKGINNLHSACGSTDIG